MCSEASLSMYMCHKCKRKWCEKVRGQTAVLAVASFMSLIKFYRVSTGHLPVSTRIRTMGMELAENLC